jgi:hypothetical protein
VFYPFESIENPITIIFSSAYFHIFEVRMWHLLSCTCISKNVLKHILKHAIIQYYAMKSKIFFLLIIKIKNIHEFNVLNLNLWIFSTEFFYIFHWHILPCFHLIFHVSLLEPYHVSTILGRIHDPPWPIEVNGE